MAQNKYLQLLRNSEFAANYEAAVALIEANAPKMDGAPIVVRFTEGEKTHALLGVSYNADGAVHFVELGGERIKDVKEALEAAIEAAKKAATTKVENKADDAHIKVTPSEPDTDGAVTYTIEGVDIASASATSESMNALQQEIDAVEELVADTKEEITSAYTAADEVLDGKISALTESSKVTLTTADAATEGYLKTYVIAQGGTEVGKIDIPKDLVVTKGEIVEKDGEKYLQLTIANQDTPVEIAVKDLVDVYTSSTYIEVGADNTISVKFNDLDAALVAEGTAVKAAIDAAQKAGVDAAAAVQSALTSHIAAYDIKVGELEAADKTNADAISALTATHTADKTELEGKISDAEAAANEYADGLKEAVDAYTVNGKAISTNPVLGASDIAVEDATAKFSGETVEAVLAELDDKIKQVQSEALGIEEGVAIEFGENEGKTVINVKVSEAEGNQLQVTENGLYVAADVDYKVIAGNGIEVTEKADEAQTISVKVAAHVEGVDANDMLTATADGLTMSNVWDCGTF